MVLYVMVAGYFPFLSPADEPLGQPQRLQAMFPRIIAGDFIPLPVTVSPCSRDIFHFFFSARNCILVMTSTI